MTMFRSSKRGVGARRRLTLAVALCLAVSLPLVTSAASTDYEARVARVLKQTPLIDGHNDLPWEIRERFQSRLSGLDLKSDTSKLTAPADSAPLMTDIVRMHAGHMGGQFWSVWVPVSLKGLPGGFRDGLHGRRRAPHSPRRQDRLHDRHRGR
jgi:hypothetical protein